MGTCFESIRFRFLTMLTQRKGFPILSSLKIKPFPALKKLMVSLLSLHYVALSYCNETGDVSRLVL